MSDTQQQINKNINNLKIIRGKVSHLLMPVRYFKTLNILPKRLFDEEIINKHFDEKWLYETYFEKYSTWSIVREYPRIKDNYFKEIEDNLNTSPFVKKYIKFNITYTDFDNNFDRFVGEINFDISPYYKLYFDRYVFDYIKTGKKKINKYNNLITIDELEKLTKEYSVYYSRYVFENRPFEYDEVCASNRLVKICPKTVKTQQYHYKSNIKKAEFIENMEFYKFAIGVSLIEDDFDETDVIIINKSNINEYI